ncbi:unnamed protein product [Rhodiola kirilowii]
MELTPSVKNILILDSKGRRVAVKYFTNEWPTISDQKDFEKLVFKEARYAKPRGRPYDQTSVRIGNKIVLYYFSGDLQFIVTGSEKENDLILAVILKGFYDVVEELTGNMFSRKVNKKSVHEHFDEVFLCLDGFVDRGLILETEGDIILYGCG